jgi:hypothetical protein
MGLVGAMLAYYVAVATLGCLPWTAAFWMGRFQLQTESFALWALAQPAPWMYNFENSTLVSDRVLTRAELLHPPQGLRWRAINHQSARVFTFAEGRAKHLREPGERYFYLRARYRGVERVSGYRIRVTGEPRLGSPAAEVVALELP